MPDAKLKQTKKTRGTKKRSDEPSLLKMSRKKKKKKLSTVIFKRKSEPSVESKDDLTWLQQHVKD